MVEQSSRIDELVQSQIPDKVMTWFEDRSAMLIDPRNYKTGNFTAFYIIHHRSGDITYAARQMKTYDTNGDTEDLVHLIDIDSNGNEEGQAEIRNNISNSNPYFKDKPFVGYTMTTEGLRNKGLGTRRLLIMNTFSKMLYGFPLHSDTLISEGAKRLWERLVKEDKATKYLEGKNDRYRFT